jgi:DHA1 family tetracycline resistance protein-like MFS transporter
LSAGIQGGLIGQLTKRFTDDWLLLASLAISGVSLAIWGFLDAVVPLAVLMVPLSFGLAVGQTVMTSALSKAVDRDEVGAVLGMQTSIMSLTRVVAPIVGGVLLERSTVWSPGLLAGVLTLAMLPWAYRTLCVHPGRPACQEEL